MNPKPTNDEALPLILLCAPVSYFLDDVHGACADCGDAIAWRPHTPAEAVRVCARCGLARMKAAGDVSVVEVTPEARRERALFPFGTRLPRN